ncbi:AraC family transcriptional regulator [Cryptosporangium aurantiacum]|uniref:AraC-type DNA-binding protein n=1 Tax=Cryptosporangium aurantiacum TaxID=134849 RepID=A0A1M7QTG5_9ACTN|nr:AraC family transcriptional regulator [Cryptosporangium aurantiacum]SHN35102.1 AraC-type DNA-binding protein [Cryptosporangium aurantiacum]
MDVLSDAVGAARTGHPTSYRVEFRAPWGRRFPSVPGAGFHVVLEGSAWLIGPGAEPVAVGVGDVVLFPHGHAHGMAGHPDAPLLPMAYVLPDDTRPTAQATVHVGPDQESPDHEGPGGPVTVMLCGLYRFARERPHPLLRDLPDVIHLPAQLGRHPGLRATVDLLATELDAPRAGSSAAITALLDLLLVHLLRARLDDDPAAGWGSALADPIVGPALRAMHDEPAKPWTVRELGGLAGASRAAFARRFKRLVGQGPLGYLTWWRMTLAADLLRRSDAPLAVVSRQIGYTSEYAFANAFRREYGTSPGRYRVLRGSP